jgi:hypothetical protein
MAAQILIRAPNLAVLYMSDDLNPRDGGAFERDIPASLLPNPCTVETLLERVSALLQYSPVDASRGRAWFDLSELFSSGKS